MSTRKLTLLTRALLALAMSITFSAAAHAQGRGHHGPPDRVPPGHAKRIVTMDHATDVTREVLVKHGYSVQRVEVVRGTRVVYYRRTNRHGHGYGPVMRIVIRPNEERIVFDAAPQPVLVDINVRLGF